MTYDDAKKELQIITNRLQDQELFSDIETYTSLSKRHSFLVEIISLFEDIAKLTKEIEEVRQIIETEEPESELALLATEELPTLEKKLLDKQALLEETLIPKEEYPHEIIVEVRAGTGGDEASLFAGELMRAYITFLTNHHIKSEVDSISQSEVGGLKEGIFSAKGEKAYELMRFESGVHRVQRVPKTEKAGRIHTSTVTVAVLPVAQEKDVEIKPNDLKIDVYRSSGPGGQSVNTTDSAVRITHLPTGLVVACQDEKSQLKNKDKAMKILRSRLLQKIKEEEQAKASEARKDQIGTGDRSEKIRTYNFPQDRVTDHRIKYSTSNIPQIMAGQFDHIVEALETAEHQIKTQQLA